VTIAVQPNATNPTRINITAHACTANTPVQLAAAVTGKHYIVQAAQIFLGPAMQASVTLLGGTGTKFQADGAANTQAGAMTQPWDYYPKRTQECADGEALNITISATGIFSGWVEVILA
jgi:hypothetical protein